MKFISWNVNGLRACVGKKFEQQFKDLDADFFCLQETKMQAGQLDLSFPGYESYWNYADKKGYSGTAIYTKHKPLSVTYGIDIDEHDHEGRVITLEMEDFYLVTVYTPNSQDGLRRLDYRMKWEDDFQAYLHKLDEKMTQLLSNGFIDTFRTLYPEQVTYSWWSYRFRAREKNTGWRIDYFLISERLKDRLEDAKIHTEIMGSDHCPVEIILK